MGVSADRGTYITLFEDEVHICYEDMNGERTSAIVDPYQEIFVGQPFETDEQYAYGTSVKYIRDESGWRLSLGAEYDSNPHVEAKLYTGKHSVSVEFDDRYPVWVECDDEWKQLG